MVLVLFVVLRVDSYRFRVVSHQARWRLGGRHLNRGLTALNGQEDSGANRDRETYDDVTENDRAQTGRGGVDTDNIQAEMGESLLDESIQNAVNNMIKKVEFQGKFEDDGSAKMTPDEKFQEIYRQLKEESAKAKENGEGPEEMRSIGGSLEQQQERAAVMLDQLFGGEQAKDPFDERAVMMKLKNMLHIEDFKELFVDPKIGDYL